MSVIIKWTVGSKSKLPKEALHCFRLSMKKMKMLLPDAKLVICYNSDLQLPDLADEVIDQRKITDHGLPYGPTGMVWKLYPPRLDINAWEIWLDNDIILYDLPTAIKNFLDSDNLLVISEAMKRSYSKKFDNLIPLGVNYNSGIVALPPKFDLRSQLELEMREPWSEYFDDQSILAVIFQRFETEVIPLREVSVVLEDKRYERGTHGMHFCGLNGGGIKNWYRFINESHKLL